MKKNKHPKFRKNLIILYLAGFFLALANALPAYINSSFIGSIVSVKYISFYFISANAVTFLAMLVFPNVIRKIGNFVSAKWMVALGVISSLILALSPAPVYLFIFFIITLVATNLLWNNMDIFVESFTSDCNTGKTRAIYFSATNAGWILSPFIASLLVTNDEKYGLVYLSSAILTAVFFLIITLNKKKVHKELKYDKVNIKATIVDFWKNSNLQGVYFSSFFLNLFFSLAVVFAPIYLHSTLGFDWSTLGIMFSIMLIPFVLIEIPAGIIADKYLGEKELTYIGMAILIISLLLFFFVKSVNPFVWGGILFFSRIGAALVEAMRESRFFKIVDAENVSHINFLRTSYPLGYLVGTGLGALILMFYPVQYTFLFLAVLFLYSFYFVYIMKDSK